MENLTFEQKVDTLSEYLLDVAYKADNMDKFGKEIENDVIMSNAKSMKEGAVGLLNYLSKLIDTAIMESGARKVPVQNVSKPKTTAKGGVNNELPHGYDARGKPDKPTLPFGGFLRT